MPTNSDYRKLIEYRFDNLTTLVNAQAKVTHEWLQKLEEHSATTNGRVSELEINLLEHPIECAKGTKIDEIKKEVDIITEDLTEYRMLKKYPKIIFLLITLAVGISLYSIFKPAKEDREAVELVNEIRDFREWFEFATPMIKGIKYSPVTRGHNPLKTDSIK